MASLLHPQVWQSKVFAFIQQDPTYQGPSVSAASPGLAYLADVLRAPTAAHPLTPAPTVGAAAPRRPFRDLSKLLCLPGLNTKQAATGWNPLRKLSEGPPMQLSWSFGSGLFPCVQIAPTHSRQPDAAPSVMAGSWLGPPPHRGRLAPLRSPGCGT